MTIKPVLVITDGDFGSNDLQLLLDAITSTDREILFFEIAAKDREVIKQLLDENEFDQKMRSSRLIVLVTAKLSPAEIRDSLVGEVATRARQSGVPCAAVTHSNELDRFTQRIYDLYPTLVVKNKKEISKQAEGLLSTLS